MHYVRDGILYELRGIDEEFDFDILRQDILDARDDFLNPIHDFQRGGFAAFHHHEDDGLLPFHHHGVRLHSTGQASGGDVPQVNEGVAVSLNRDFVEILDL